MKNNKILLRIAAEAEKEDIEENDIKIEENNDDKEEENDKDNSDDDNDDLEFDFDALFNKEEQPKSDIEKMVTKSLDVDTFDPYNEPEAQVNKRISNELISNTFNVLSNDGRGVLKRIEDFKFKIVQAINMLNGDEELKTKVEQKQKILESAAAQIYGIVFDLENYDLTPNYEDEQLAGESFPTMDISDDNEENIDMNDEDLDTDIDTDIDDNTENGNNMDKIPIDEGELAQGGFEDIPVDESEEA